MNLIVFDLEWNIGYQPKTFLYHGAELTLRGEIIQIGAVRINARGDVLDTFEVNLRPRIFRKLQHHIAKVTGLSQGDLDAGLPMREGLQKFLDWAGPDAELAEWGLDDVPVLKQNLFLVGLDENWPDRWYDLQRIFLQAYPRREGEGLTLESVVDRLGIPKEEPFHNALDDALYTAKICRKLPLAEGLATYPTEEELLTEESGREFFAGQSWCGVAEDEAGKVLGLYILHPNNVGRCGHICNASYAVSKKARGLHIGEKLVLDCLKEGKKHGFGVLQFNAVVATNLHARHLYERLGFIQLGTIPKGFRMKDGHYEDICPYYKEL